VTSKVSASTPYAKNYGMSHSGIISPMMKSYSEMALNNCMITWQYKYFVFHVTVE